MLNGGWVKLHRKIAKWEWWTDPNTAHLFIHLLLSANHEDRRWKGVLVRKGQLITGRNSLSLETGLSHRAVRTCLEHLKSTNEVAIQATKRYSVITICKWDTYQDTKLTNGQASGQVNAQAPTKHRPSTDQAPTTNKNVRIEEGEELKNEDVGLLALTPEDQPQQKPAAAGSASKLSDSDWLAALAKDPTYAGIDVNREHGKMVNWCNVNRRQPTRRRFLNWLNRAERPMSNANPGANRQPHVEPDHTKPW